MPSLLAVVYAQVPGGKYSLSYSKKEEREKERGKYPGFATANSPSFSNSKEAISSEI
jgi:hypothetical protein